MARPLRVRKPTLRQLRRLQQLLESEASARQRRRAEVLLLYAAGHDAISMAQALQAHPQTIYADLRAFQQHTACAASNRHLYGARGPASARPSGTRWSVWLIPPPRNSVCLGAAGPWRNCGTICSGTRWSAPSAANTCGAF
jgi:hypothetical protein